MRGRVAERGRLPKCEGPARMFDSPGSAPGERVVGQASETRGRREVGRETFTWTCPLPHVGPAPHCQGSGTMRRAARGGVNRVEREPLGSPGACAPSKFPLRTYHIYVPARGVGELLLRAGGLTTHTEVQGRREGRREGKCHCWVGPCTSPRHVRTVRTGEVSEAEPGRGLRGACVDPMAHLLQLTCPSPLALHSSVPW